MFAPKTDEQLIAKALAGSEKAWIAIVKRYEKRLYNYALRMSGSPDDALDILQNVFLSVYRNLDSYRGEGAFVTWLFRIASFRATDFFRKKNFKVGSIEDEDEILDEMNLHQPEQALDSIQDNNGIAKIMAKLSTEQRHVVELKFFQNFTFDEISRQLGISPNTAKTRLYAALKHMRAQPELEKKYVGDFL
ncbi:MAG: RNA polymerase sigma-70 factor (ECF subfamily) [Candidatus Azotimanducaceae bacterium]|jgi:RNA polymerase sigma-70 factor (ECF subfamily)